MAPTHVSDPPAIAAGAARLDTFVEQAKPLVPRVRVTPAGRDPISRLGAQRLNQHGMLLADNIRNALYQLDLGAFAMGDSAESFSLGDAEGAEPIWRADGVPARWTGDRVRNPVGRPAPFAPQTLPEVPDVPETGFIDAETFARQLWAGSTESAATYGARWITWGSGGVQHEEMTTQVRHARDVSVPWQPVGTQVANLFGKFDTWHQQNGIDVSALVEQAGSYVRAYDTAKRNHPTAEQMQHAKQSVRETTREVRRAEAELRRAQARAATDYGASAAAAAANLTTAQGNLQQAQTNLQQLDQKAQEAQRAYWGAIESKVPAAHVSSAGEAPRIANPLGGLGNALGDIGRGLLSGLPGMLGMLNQPGGLDIPSVPPIPQPPTVPPSPTAPAAPNSDAMPQMPGVPPLGDPGATSDDELLEDPYLEEPYPLDDYGGYGGGPGGGGVGGMPTSAMAGVPLTGTGGSAPKVAAARQFGMPAAGGRAAGAGGMPYMPFMPGMGGANPNTGDRKNPFAEEKKIVDDDELRSSALASATVNEKPPVLPPEATRPTPDRTSATNQESAIA